MRPDRAGPALIRSPWSGRRVASGLLRRKDIAADTVLYVATIIITVPSIALFGIMIPFLSLIGQGLGDLSAFIAELVGGDRTLKRLRLISVEEVMMKDPPRVTEGDSLHEAVSLMQENGHQAVIMVGPTARAALCA